MKFSEQKDLDAILAKARAHLPVDEAAGRHAGYSDPEPFRVFFALFPPQRATLWLLLILLGPAALAMLWTFLPEQELAWTELSLWALSALACLRLLIGFLLWAGEYWQFRYWRQSLSLRVEGWTALTETGHFTDHRYWRTPCRITLHLRSNASWNDESLQAILLMFRIEANHCGYRPNMAQGSDPRHAWELSGQSITGSVNCRVARQIFELCKHLSVLNRVRPTVESLLITAEEPEFFVPPFRSLTSV